MEKSNGNTAKSTGQVPEWYWTKGLHDACITDIEAVEFPFDYNRVAEEKGKYDRNCLTLKIDAKGAMFDMSVKEIRLYNYKILTPDVAFENRKMLWWFADRLTRGAERYVLEIDVRDFDSHREKLTVVIRFDRAEVDRNENDTRIL